MSARWSRLVAALVIMAAVLVAGSASASGAPAQDHPAVGGNVGYQPVGAYDAVLPEAVPVVGSDTAGPVAATAHMAAAHVYDGPVVSRAGANVSIPAENPFHQVDAGGGRRASRALGVEGISMTPVSLTSTPRGVSAFDDLAHSGSGIQSYRAQQAATRGLGGEIQAHHLIERRFANVMGGNTDDWASIVVTRAEHQQFTNAWRQAIPYGPTGTGMATRAQVEAAARQIYADYPEILRALGL